MEHMFDDAEIESQEAKRAKAHALLDAVLDVDP